MLTLSKTRIVLLLHQSHPRTCPFSTLVSSRQTFEHNLQIKSLSRAGNLTAARQLFDRMPVRDVVSWNSIITAHWRSSDIQESKKLFNSMPQRSTISWNLMIAGCLENGMPDDALDYFRRMPDRNVASWNAVISGLSKLGRMDEAEKLFGEMPVRNVVSYTAMVDGWARVGEVERAREVFDRMPERNSVTWAAMVCGYVSNGMLEEAERMFWSMPEKSVEAVTAMITGHCVAGEVESARRLFDGIREKDLVSWNAMISGYANNDHDEEVLKLHREMLALGMKPDHVTLIAILMACSALGLLQRGRQTHAIAMKTRLDSNASLSNALITMYSKCGSIGDSNFVFREIQNCDVVSWNTIIAAWAQHGQYQRVLDLFCEMEANGVTPNGITFLSILSAYRHVGIVNESLTLFNLMSSKYGVTPRSEHYACVVDILSRSGQLEKAYECIKEMPFAAGTTVWGALLGGCQIYSNVELGELAAEKLLKLDPQNPGTYIILSNIYAKAGMWEGVTWVRTMMKDQGIKKQPGYSWIEITDQVHSFLMADTSHPDIDKVYFELERISLHMEKALEEDVCITR